MAAIDTVIADFNIGIKGEDQLNRAIKTIKEYKEQTDKAEKGSMEWMEAQNKLGMATKKLSDELEKNGKSLKDFNMQVDSNQKGFKRFEGGLSSLAKKAGPALGVIFAADQLIQYGRELIKLERSYAKLFRTVNQYSNLEGKALDKAAARIQSLSKVYNKSTEDLTQSINSFSKQLDIDFIEALELVEKGFILGADAGGDFLSKLEEYPVQFKNAKLSAQDFVRFAVQEVRGGVFNDKLLDTVKELGLRLRELNKAQRDALKPLGEDFSRRIVKDLQTGGRSIVDIFNDIIKKSKEVGLNIQQVQTIIADLGGGALEDLGGVEEAYEQITAAIELNLEASSDLEKRNEALLASTTKLADEEARLARNLEGLSDNFGDFITDLQTRGLKVLNLTLEVFQQITDATGFRIRQALASTVSDNNDRLKEAGKNIDELTKLAERAERKIAKINDRIRIQTDFDDEKGLKESNGELKVYLDLLEKVNTKIAEVNGEGGNESASKLTKGQRNQIRLFREMVDTTREYGQALTEVELETLSKAIEERKKAVAAYAELAKDIRLALREAEAKLLGSKALEFELDRDKLRDEFKEKQKEVQEAGEAAGIPQVEIDVELKLNEETLKKELKKLRREYLAAIAPTTKGLSGLSGNVTVPGADGSGKLPLVGRDISDQAKERLRAKEQEELLTDDLRDGLDEREQAYVDFYTSVRNAVLDFTNFQLSQIDREIDYRADRIRYLSDIQSGSAEEALEKEKQIQDKALERRRQIANAQRTIAVAEAGVNIGLGISKVFAETGPGAPLTVPLILGLVSTLIASAGGLAASLLPAFKDGVVDFRGKGSETSDSNIAMISNHESIITAKGTRLAPEALRLINEGKLSDRDIFTDLSPLVLSGGNGKAEKEQKRTNDMLEEVMRKISTPEVHKHYYDEKGYRKRLTEIRKRSDKIQGKR